MDMQLQRRADAAPIATITQGFGSQEIEVRGERASDAVAAREQAMVQARFIVAIQRPRDVMDFRSRLLKECQRPGFADVAMFRRPVGKARNERTGKWEEVYAEGPSIRMIETALQLFRNVQAMSTTVYDDPQLRIVKVSVLDFENNINFDQEVNIPKSVEKRGDREGGAPKGREVIGQRTNSYGEQTYLVRATDDEIIVKQAALVSKAIRTCGQRLLPRDVIEEAIAAIRATTQDAARNDPDGEKKKLLDAFSGLQVMPSDLAVYIGHSVDRITPAEIAELRDVYRTLKTAESTWDEILAAKDTIPEPELQKEVGDRLKAKADTERKQSTVTEPDPDPDYTPAQLEEMRRRDLADAAAEADNQQPQPSTRRRGI